MQRKLPKRLKNEKIETAHVTHVTIRKSNKIDPNIDNRMIHHSPKPDPVSFHNSSSIVLKRISSVDRERSPSITRTYPSDHFLTQSSKNIWSDRRVLIQSHQQPPTKPKKIISPKQCVVISVLSVVMVTVILTAILLGALMPWKKPSRTLPTNSAPTLRWNSTGITVVGSSNASAGNASNQLNRPKDLLLIDENLLYIVDCNNHRVQRFQLGSSSGTTVAGQANGPGGVSSNQLRNPSGIHADSTGGIFVSDSGNHRIQYWPNGASQGTTIAGSSTGVFGSTNSTLHDPVGLVRNETSGTLYIADFGNNRVMGYLFNATSGSLAAGDGTFGTGSTQLWKPAGLYLDTFSNSLVIANHNAKNIVRWTLGGHNWTLLAGDTNALSGNNATLLNYPQHVTFDPMGNMYVVDKNNHRIQLFMLGHIDGITIAGVSSTPGSSSNLLNTPHAVRLDNQLNLYVADTNNNRIQKFQRY